MKETRLSLVLALASIAVCLYGTFRVVWFVTQVPWGKGGAIGREIFIEATIGRLRFLTVCALIGLGLAGLASWRTPGNRFAIAAITANVVALGAVLLAMLFLVSPAPPI